MRKTRFYLCLLIMAMSCAMLGCSDDDNTPEPEPEPVPPIVDPEPEPEPEPVVDTVACWHSLRFDNYMSYRYYDFQKFEYDTLGRVQKFEMDEGPIEGWDFHEYVTVEWGEWGNKQVVMAYEEKGVAGADCKATYTLNDKGWMEKVVVEKGGSKLEEYQAEYTETTFTLYAVKTTGKEKLYSAGMAAGGRYGDWTVTEAVGAKVTVDYEDFEGYEGMTDLRGYLDILLTTSYAGWLMPKCVLWAHVAAMLPGQTKAYNHPVITYEGTTQDLYSMELQDFSGPVILGISEATMEDSPLDVWVSSPEMSMFFIPKVVTYPVKK